MEVNDYSKAWIAHGLPELKPCPLPFCDGEGIYNESIETVSVYCHQCGLMLNNEFAWEYGCIELWNARTGAEIDALFDVGQHHLLEGQGTIKATAAPGYFVYGKA